MGDDKDKKPTKGKAPDKGGDAKAKQDGNAKDTPQQDKDDGADEVGGVDLRDLRDAYDHAHDEENILFNKRAIGAREVLTALNEADPPSLADELMKSLVIAGLGFASGYVTAAITAKLIDPLAVALTNAVQTALDDGIKDALTKVAARLAEPGGNSKSEFFASQEEGLESLRGTGLSSIIKQRRVAEDKVLKADKANQAKVLADETKGAQQFATSVKATADQARNIQFRESLAKWMNAMSRSEMGVHDKPGFEKGTNLFGGGNKGLDNDDPKSFYKTGAAKGVIYINWGMTESRPHVGNSAKWPSVKMSGMTQAALDRIKGTPIKDLGMPIVASGYIYDGFLDGLDISLTGDNNVQIGKNESGTYFFAGSSEGASAMRKLTGKKDNITAAMDLIDNDIGTAKLDNVLLI